jgi:hypothetical protein
LRFIAAGVRKVSSAGGSVTSRQTSFRCWFWNGVFFAAKRELRDPPDRVERSDLAEILDHGSYQLSLMRLVTTIESDYIK